MTAEIDWSRIETVLLDMDGTILDLAFDNYFWSELVPARYAQARGLEPAAARAELMPLFDAKRGSLDWYCLDFWSDRLQLDISTLKSDVAERIGILPGAHAGLEALRASGRRLLLVTNAHPHSLAIKLEKTGIDVHFDATISTHEFGMPKEGPGFWTAFASRYAVNLQDSLLADDNLPILDVARQGGVGQVVWIRRPDSRTPAREHRTGTHSIHGLEDLLPVPPRGG